MTLVRLLEEGFEVSGKSRKELADHLEISNTSITKWISKTPRDPIPWRHWRAICDFLNIPWMKWWTAAQKDSPRNAACYRRFARDLMQTHRRFMRVA